jgi:pimeloyl-ACP methyl ester carboxylesterase
MNLPLAITLARQLDALYRGAVKPTLEDAVSDTQVQVEIHDRVAHVLFPGSASVRDARTDAMIKKMEWLHEGRVHRGFMRAYSCIAQRLIVALAETDEVILAGHSLGGALATLAADDLSRLGWKVSGVYTFGSPRVGNWEFARQYNDRLANFTFRITNAGDPVPWVPFVFGTYRHVAREFYLNRDGGVDIEPWPITHVQEAVTALSADSTAFALAGEHSLQRYLAKLEALA